MKNSLFVCPLNGVKITLQKRKWTFITVFKVSVKKHKHSVRKKRWETRLKNTIHNSHDYGTTYRVRDCTVSGEAPLCVARVGHLAVAAARPLRSLPWSFNMCVLIIGSKHYRLILQAVQVWTLVVKQDFIASEMRDAQLCVTKGILLKVHTCIRTYSE